MDCGPWSSSIVHGPKHEKTPAWEPGRAGRSGAVERAGCYQRVGVLGRGRITDMKRIYEWERISTAELDTTGIVSYGLASMAQRKPRYSNDVSKPYMNINRRIKEAVPIKASQSGTQVTITIPILPHRGRNESRQYSNGYLDCPSFDRHFAKNMLRLSMTHLA